MLPIVERTSLWIWRISYINVICMFFLDCQNILLADTFKLNWQSAEATRVVETTLSDLLYYVGGFDLLM